MPAESHSPTTKTTKPDWLNKTIAAKLLHRDEEVREAAKSRAYLAACEIVENSFYKKLAELAPRKFPRGVEFPGEYQLKFSCVVNAPYLAMSRWELDKLGCESAVKQADAVGKFAIDDWASEAVEPYLHFDVRIPEIESMLKSALKELNDAQSAERCVMAWLMAGRRGKPPSWRDLDMLVRENPDLIKVGAQEAFNRGFVPPPWLTTAVTGW